MPASSWCSSAPPGCGKSTLLRMIAGLEEVTEGRILIGDRDVTDLRPRDRDIAMVFQNYALYPQMTVEENLGFGLKLRRVSKPERQVAGRSGGGHARSEGADGTAARIPLGRPASAGGDGAGDGAGAEGVPDGRAALEPRREAPRRDAGRAHPAPRPARCDDRLRHPRPGRGDDAGPARRRHARRRPAAVRHAAEAVPSAGEPLRGGIHGLAGDERRRSRGGRRAGPVRRAHRAARPGVTSCRRQPHGHPRHPPDRSPASRRGTGRPSRDHGAPGRRSRSSAASPTSSSRSRRHVSRPTPRGPRSRPPATTTRRCWRTTSGPGSAPRSTGGGKSGSVRRSSSRSITSTSTSSTR